MKKAAEGRPQGGLVLKPACVPARQEVQPDPRGRHQGWNMSRPVADTAGQVSRDRRQVRFHRRQARPGRPQVTRHRVARLGQVTIGRRVSIPGRAQSIPGRAQSVTGHGLSITRLRRSIAGRRVSIPRHVRSSTGPARSTIRLMPSGVMTIVRSPPSPEPDQGAPPWTLKSRRWFAGSGQCAPAHARRVDRSRRSVTIHAQRIDRPRRSVTAYARRIDRPRRSVTAPARRIDRPRRSVTAPAQRIDRPRRSVRTPAQRIDRLPQLVRARTPPGRRKIRTAASSRGRSPVAPASSCPAAASA